MKFYSLYIILNKQLSKYQIFFFLNSIKGVIFIYKIKEKKAKATIIELEIKQKNFFSIRSISKLKLKLN